MCPSLSNGNHNRGHTDKTIYMACQPIDQLEDDMGKAEEATYKQGQAHVTIRGAVEALIVVDQDQTTLLVQKQEILYMRMNNTELEMVLSMLR